MKTKKSIALLLCLLLTLTLFVPSSTAFAVDGDSGTDTGMKVSKTATANDDGSYTIKLEAYATGSKFISEVKKDIPTDIVLVLDQSGSMTGAMPTTTMTEYTDKRNANYYANRNNGGNDNLWHKLSDGSYVSVSVEVTNTTSSYTIYNASSSDQKNEEYYQNQANLYYLDSDGEYYPISVDKKYDGVLSRSYTYTYSANGETIATGKTSWNFDIWNYTDDTTPDIVFYTRATDYTNATYTYTYTATDNTTTTITSSTGSEGICATTFYSKTTNSSSTRLDALKTAVTGFVNNVAKKAAGEDGDISTTDDNINHRIAVVGFASKSGNGNNTELLSIAGRNSGSVGVSYNSITNQNYKDVLQDMDSANGQQMVSNAIAALAAEGATRTDLGLEMAKNILDKNPVQDNEKRNRVVIVFTDGSPTSSNGFEKEVAQTAISKAAEIKNEKTSVYSVGIFSGADATSPGTEPSGNLGQNSSSLPAASNWFMQKLSSNNGKPQTPSYYLSAADADTLNNIFKQISDQIESGGSSTTLTEQAVVKDIIAPQFTLPAGADAGDITLETYACTGKSGDVYTWSKNETAMGATATVSGDEVSVTGFNFSDNWCGTVNNNGITTYRGNKLVISFTVSPKPGFLGGNNVFTNTSAGVYADSNATTPVVTFESPQVNVPIKPITVTAQDQNVYLLADVSVNALKAATTVKVGDVELDLTKEHYGLEAWQYAYVDIQSRVTYHDPDDDATDLTGLTDDVAYTVAVTVSPKEEPESSSDGESAVSRNENDSANINVFKPVLTFKDSAEDYLSTYMFPGYYEQAGKGQNHVSDVWMHGSEEADTTKMGNAPELTLVYTADGADITGLANGVGNGTIAADHDIPVNVVVNIGETSVTDYVTFNHQPCSADSGCGWNYEASHAGNATISGTEQSKPEFLIHVKNIVADLTITKTGLNTNVYLTGDNESAIVTVACTEPGTDSRTWTVVLTKKDNWRATLSGLKVGETYTVTEQTGWTWRYTSTTNTSPVTIVKGGSSVTIVNTQTNPYWLGGDNYCVNVFASDASTTN